MRDFVETCRDVAVQRPLIRGGGQQADLSDSVVGSALGAEAVGTRLEQGRRRGAVSAVSAGGFLAAALRTGRATSIASGSPPTRRVGGVMRAPLGGRPGSTDRGTCARHHSMPTRAACAENEVPAARPRRDRPAARRCSPATSFDPVVPRTGWDPSPCTGLSPAPSTTVPPPRPGGDSGRCACPEPKGSAGTAGALPTFTNHRSAGSAPSFTPAASPNSTATRHPASPARRTNTRTR